MKSENIKNIKFEIKEYIKFIYNKLYTYFKYIGSVLTAISATIGIYVFFSPKTENSAIEQVRPWVHILNAEIKDISIDDNGASITVLFNVENFGTSIAEKVFARGDVYAEMSILDHSDRADAACQHRPDAVQNYDKIDVFRGKPQQLKFNTLFISKKDIIAARQADAMRQIGENRQRIINLPLRTAFYVAGCIIYTYQRGKQIGLTPFLMNVYRRCDGPTGHCSFDAHIPVSYGEREIAAEFDWGGLVAK